MLRALYDCPNVPLGPEGMRCRLVVATHPAGVTKSRIGVTHSGVVYELALSGPASERVLPPVMWWRCICIVVPLRMP